MEALRILYIIISQRLFLAVVSAWCLTQGIKVMLSIIIEKKLKWQRFIEPGGMPSSHAAVVMALLTGVGIKEGIESTIFLVTLIFASVTIYEAIGVRREVGEQAKLLNKILRPSSPERSHQLKEQLGHRPIEVSIGGIIGLLMGFLWM